MGDPDTPEVKANELVVKTENGATKMYLNGAEIYNANPELLISTKSHIPDSGVRIQLELYAKINIE